MPVPALPSWNGRALRRWSPETAGAAGSGQSARVSSEAVHSRSQPLAQSVEPSLSRIGHLAKRSAGRLGAAAFGQISHSRTYRQGKAQLDHGASPIYRRRRPAKSTRQLAQSVGSQSGTLIEELVGQSVLALQRAVDAKKARKDASDAFDALPDDSAKQIATIKGIGQRTAAVLVAKIASIDRFPTADHLTSYFGIFPEEKSFWSRSIRQPLSSGRKCMSRKGNDLVRKYFWMAAMSAISCNPAVATCTDGYGPRPTR